MAGRRTKVSPADRAIDSAAGVAEREVMAEETFPSLSAFEIQAFHFWFVAGFRAAAHGEPAKSDWTGAMERLPDIGFNQDAYRVGYARGGAYEAPAAR